MTKKLTILLLTMLISATFTSFAEDTEKAPILPQKLKLTLQDAVYKGIVNSIILKQIQCEIDLAIVTSDKAHNNATSLRQADRDLSNANKQIISQKANLDSKQADIISAQSLIDQGIAPVDIPIKDPSTGKTIATITAGSNISDFMTSIGKSDATSTIITSVKSDLSSKQAQLDAGKVQLETASATLNNAQGGLLSTLTDAGVKIGDKIGSNTTTSYGTNQTGQLLITMADATLAVTTNSYDIYKNQIAMQIQKNYYDVLRLQAIVTAKAKAMERGEKQAKFSEDSYIEGMKAKDDMLIAKTYYDGTKIEYKKAVGDLKNALTELKKNMNIPFDTEIELLDPLVDDVESQDLQFGIKNGLEKRLEMQKANAQVIVYNKNFDAATRVTAENTYIYREAKLLSDKAKIELENTKINVMSSIYQSYETVQTVGEMLDDSKAMIAMAKETLEIATYKYKEGFGIENSLLKKLDIESSSGTIVEVLAAEQNLIEIEEKIIEIKYNYNLAKAKYLNDIGVLKF